MNIPAGKVLNHIVFSVDLHCIASVPVLEIPEN